MAPKPKPKPLSKMTPAEIKASKAVLKNKEALAKEKLKKKNTAIANKVKGLRGGGGLRGGMGGFGGGSGLRGSVNK
jgi:uncharacterized membrane protein